MLVLGVSRRFGPRWSAYDYDVTAATTTTTTAVMKFMTMIATTSIVKTKMTAQTRRATKMSMHTVKAKKMKSKSYNYSSQVCMRDENNRSSARSSEFGA